MLRGSTAQESAGCDCKSGSKQRAAARGCSLSDSRAAVASIQGFGVRAGMHGPRTRWEEHNDGAEPPNPISKHAADPQLTEMAARLSHPSERTEPNVADLLVAHILLLNLSSAL